MSTLITQLTASPASLLGTIAVVMIFLYMARPFAHDVIKSFCAIIHSGMRITSRSLIEAERKLDKRNKEVLLAAGIENQERHIAREFERVETVVKRDLSGYPALNRSLSDLVTKIDEDYRESTEVPPDPPKWVEAVQAVAKIPSADSMTGSILKKINETIIAHHKEAMGAYRMSTSTRHGLLKKMMPLWRNMDKTLTKVDKTIIGLQERATEIDKSMKEFEEIEKGTDKAIRLLHSSSLTQFVISGFVMLIAFGGAVINFNLIALPMGEMVGGSTYIGMFKTSDIAALVIILVEVSMGLFFMESLGITRLFPIIRQLDDKMRKRMMVTSITILTVLATIEMSLAFFRDTLIASDQALIQTLAGTESIGQAEGEWIPTAGQMVMGFVLPFALTFVAIPLESFIGSSRTMVGLALQFFLMTLAYTLRVIGLFFNKLSRMMVNFYDLFVFLPLWIEKMAKGVKAK